MPEYKCELCNFCCKRPSQLKEHFKTQKHKANMFNKEPDSAVQLQENQLQTIMNHIVELQSKVHFLEQALLSNNCDKYATETGQQNTNCQVTNNTIQNNININVSAPTINSDSPYAFGQEDWSYITDKEMKKIMSGVNSCVPTLVEKLHFDSKHPENHNIKIQNKSRSEIKVFDGNMWRTQDKNTTVDELINNIRGRLDDHEENFLTEASSAVSHQWERYWNDMNAKKQREVRKKVIGTIHDCQENLKSADTSNEGLLLSSDDEGITISVDSQSPNK